MPLLFALFIVMLVNFPSAVLAQETSTQIRGPRSTDAPPMPQTIGPLSPADTLWRVAERIRPDANISLYQVMYALYLKNPDAFLEGNLNHLRPGAVLILPSAEEMRQVDLALARAKSEQDDKLWEARQKAARADAKPVKRSPQSAVEDNKQLQAELAKLSAQQRQDLDILRSQFADSMQLVDTMVDENMQLKTSLAKLQQELELIKAQLSDDEVIQQQIELLLKQQAELLAAKAAADAEAAQASDWQQWLTHPLAWVLAACIPALLILFGILLWVKKRSQHTEQVVNAATQESAANPAYQSPLPPLDTADVDDSLFEIDDALLEDAFNEPEPTNKPVVDDDLLAFDDDALSFEDDSLLPPDTPTDDKAAPGTGDDALDEFDPDNILSDDDLSALLAAADDDDAIELADESLGKDDLPDTRDIDEIVTPAKAQEGGEPELDAFDIDELIEEVDLDQLEQDVPIEAGTVALTDVAEPDISLVDETFSDEPSLEDTLPDSRQLNQQTDTAFDEQTLTQEQQLSRAMASAGAVDDSALLEVATDEDAVFDSSELDAFAESLAGEQEPALTDDDTISDNAATETDIDALNAELTELLDQAEQDRPQQAAQPERIDQRVSADDNLTLPVEGDAGNFDLSEDDRALLDDFDLAAEVQPVQASEPVVLDLTTQDDESVTMPNDAALSVENPSKILEQYPKLELSDDELSDELDPELLLSELEQLDGQDEVGDTDAIELELDPMPDAQFDSLMSELEAMADNLDAAEQELELQSDESSVQQTATEDAGAFDFSDDDFVEIDTLLANAGQPEQDSERFNQLNVDVGLEDYADIIGEHQQLDVDVEDNGYSAKLDLVRAYIEMDDDESANQLLDDIMASDAPEHVKAEAQSLRQ
ncbi:FimV/HubP family polar landmark protein [Rheinheimera sp. FR7-31]|uniref:FimV/HubP family polar landmark protein n=1 Tax=Rheinheimera fenheensis TaxID=3152295 RepID=UPI00325DCA16